MPTDNLEQALRLYWEDLVTTLRLSGGPEGPEWVGENGELRVRPGYGVWRWGPERGDSLLTLVQRAGNHRTAAAARNWCENWLAERDAGWRASTAVPRRRRARLVANLCPPEREAALRAAYPDLKAPTLWNRWNVREPFYVERVHEYHNAEGRLFLLAARVRHRDPLIPKKFFAAAHFPGSGEDLGGWERVHGHRVLGTGLPLYRLPELLRRPADPVLVVEGEKTAELAAERLPNLVVVTWFGGANRYRDTDWSPLSGRRVALWPDADEPGAGAMNRLSAHLRQQHTPYVGIVPAAGLRLPSGWDLGDDWPGDFGLEHARREIDKALALPDWLHEINARYALVNNQGQATIYYRAELTGPEPFRRAYERWLPIKEENFHRWFANRHVFGTRVDRNDNPILVPASTAWLEHPERAEYDRLVFTAGDVPARALNELRPVDPVPDASGARRPWTVLRYFYHVLCRKRPKEFKLLVQLLAELVQQPTRPWGVAIVLKGEKGIGKTKFGELIADLYPAHSVIHTNYDHAMTQHNDWARGRIFVFFDEALYAGDRKHESYLKNMITGYVLQTQAKFHDQVSTPNCMHIVLAGNPDRLVNATVDERRYFVLEVANEKRGDEGYFSALTEAWAAGEREQLINLLAAVDITRRERRRVPDNEELLEQKVESLDDVRAWLMWEGDQPSWRTDYMAHELYERYRNWSQEAGVRGVHNTASFFKRVKNILGNHYQSYNKKVQGRVWKAVRLPPATALARLVVPGWEPKLDITELGEGNVSGSFTPKEPF